MGRRCSLLPALHRGQETLTGTCLWNTHAYGWFIQWNKQIVPVLQAKQRQMQDQGLQDLQASLQPRARCPLWRALLAPVFVAQELYPVEMTWPGAVELGCLLWHHGSKGNVTPTVKQEMNKK